MSRVASFLLSSRRRSIQAISFLIMNSFFFKDLKVLPCLGLNCYACPAAIFACPIGTLQHFAATGQIPFYTLGALGLWGVIGGRLACGWLCPFGWLQELMYGLRQFRLPRWRVSDRLGWLRYAFLIVLVGLIAFVTHEPWFCKLCPAGTLEAGIPLVLTDADLRTQAGWLFAVKLLILVGFLIWMMSSKRPFCRFVCPLGAIWSPFNRMSSLRLTVDQTMCTECDACREVCPVDICIYEDPDSSRCIRCMECIKVCPQACIALTAE